MKLTGVAATLTNFGTEPGSMEKLATFLGDSPERFMYGNVKYIHQGHINLCTEACINMMLAFHGKPHQETLDKNPRGMMESQTSWDMVDKLKEAGLRRIRLRLPSNRQWKAVDLAKNLREFGPAICSITNNHGISYHAILLIGVNENEVLYHDPWTREFETMPLSVFNNKLEWEDNLCIMPFQPNDEAEVESPTRHAPTTTRVGLLMQAQNRKASLFPVVTQEPPELPETP